MRWEYPGAAITRHGARRFRQRVGLPARAASRQLAKVRAEGLTPDRLTGPARMKVGILIQRYEGRERPAEYLVYRDFLYIFDPESAALITVFSILERGAH